MSAAPPDRIGPMVDANVHLWDQAGNPVFWLSDRTMVVDMLGNYDSLPDRYTLDDYLESTAPSPVDGVIWSDAGAADPIAALDWVRRQDRHGVLAGLVTLGDPYAPGFGDFVERVRSEALVSSVRIRLVQALRTDAPRDDEPAAGDRLVDGLRALAAAGLVATIETSANQVPWVAALADELPELRIVLDHFGWPSDLGADGRRAHFDALRPLADRANVAARLDALGTIFASWDVEMVRPWLRGVVEIFGCDRCMFGSDMPIETLRSTFGDLRRAYDAIFDGRSDDERRQLFHDTALHWLGARS
jgi:predicted TIM-barrel fold metal-dependent hydrolase